MKMHFNLNKICMMYNIYLTIFILKYKIIFENILY